MDPTNILMEHFMTLYFPIFVALVIIVACYILCRLMWSSRNLTPERYVCQGEISTPAKVVAIDCEMIHCSPTEGWLSKAVPKIGKRKNKKSKEVAVAAHCAIVDNDCNVLFDKYISNDMEATDWKGASVNKGMPFSEAREHILGILRGKLIVLHDKKHDMRSLQIHFDRDIPLKNIRDTSTCQILREEANIPDSSPNVGLKELIKAIFGDNIQRGKHNPVEDAKAAMRLYRHIEKEWERKIANTGDVCQSSLFDDSDSSEC